MTSASRTIARIVGPVATALALTEWANMGIFASQIAPVVYLNGTLLLTAGIAIVQSHNRWFWGWPLVVTLAGWGITALGLLRMIAPEAATTSEGPVTNVILLVLGAVGVFLCVKGYSLPSADRNG